MVYNMKKCGRIGLLSLVAICLISCGRGNEPKQDEELVQEWGIVAQDVFLTVGMEKEDTIIQLQEEPEYFEAPSCAYEGTDYIYTYGNYTVTCCGEDREVVSSIVITSDLICTTEGVTIGDTKEQVKAVYGEPREETEQLLVYEENHICLRIIFENQGVVSIEFQKVW